MFNAAVITISDSCFEGRRDDKSGPTVVELLEASGYNAQLYEILPDEQRIIENRLAELCDNGGIDLIVTTGGTGFSLRDVTPEATKAVCPRLVPGIPEAMRSASMSVTPKSMLSRAVAGIRNRSLIINLPGSPKAAAECLGAVLEPVYHGLEILTGRASECGR